jgi:hypothetical protein
VREVRSIHVPSFCDLSIRGRTKPRRLLRNASFTRQPTQGISCTTQLIPYCTTGFTRKNLSSSFRTRPLGVFPNRINLELWILWTVGRTPWTGDQPSRKAATYTEHKHRGNADRQPCLKWNSNPRSQCFSGRRYFMPQTTHSHCDRQERIRNYKNKWLNDMLRTDASGLIQKS